MYFFLLLAFSSQLVSPVPICNNSAIAYESGTVSSSEDWPYPNTNCSILLVPANGTYLFIQITKFMSKQGDQLWIHDGDSMFSPTYGILEGNYTEQMLDMLNYVIGQTKFDMVFLEIIVTNTSDVEFPGFYLEFSSVLPAQEEPPPDYEGIPEIFIGTKEYEFDGRSIFFFNCSMPTSQILWRIADETDTPLNVNMCVWYEHYPFQKHDCDYYYSSGEGKDAGTVEVSAFGPIPPQMGIWFLKIEPDSTDDQDTPTNAKSAKVTVELTDCGPDCLFCNDEPGCEKREVMECVCDLDSSCCWGEHWDNQCILIAIYDCGCLYGAMDYDSKYVPNLAHPWHQPGVNSTEAPTPISDVNNGVEGQIPCNDLPPRENENTLFQYYHQGHDYDIYWMAGDTISDGSVLNYENSANLRFFIRPTGVGKNDRIRLKFTRFHTMANDTLTICDVDATWHKNFEYCQGSYEGFYHPEESLEYESQFNAISMYFVTDASETSLGWEMEYELIVAEEEEPLISKGELIAIIVCSSVFVLALIAFSAWCCARKRTKRLKGGESDQNGDISPKNLSPKNTTQPSAPGSGSDSGLEGQRLIKSSPKLDDQEFIDINGPRAFAGVHPLPPPATGEALQQSSFNLNSAYGNNCPHCRSALNFCYQCGTVFSSPEQLNEHHRARYKCPFCSACMDVTNVAAFRAHILKHQQIGTIVNQPEEKGGPFYRPHVRQISGDSVKRIKIEAESILQGDNRGKFYCDICQKNFVKKYNLTVHIQVVHNKELRFQCLICGKRFPLNQTLKAHQLRHLGLKPHKCNWCGAAFTEKKNLKRHKRSDHKQSCGRCTKRFISKTALKTHFQEEHTPGGAKRAQNIAKMEQRGQALAERLMENPMYYHQTLPSVAITPKMEYTGSTEPGYVINGSPVVHGSPVVDIRSPEVDLRNTVVDLGDSSENKKPSVDTLCAGENEVAASTSAPVVNPNRGVKRKNGALCDPDLIAYPNSSHMTDIPQSHQFFGSSSSPMNLSIPPSFSTSAVLLDSPSRTSVGSLGSLGMFDFQQPVTADLHSIPFDQYQPHSIKYEQFNLRHVAAQQLQQPGFPTSLYPQTNPYLTELNQSLPCPICRRNFYSQAEFIEHVKNDHEAGEHKQSHSSGGSGSGSGRNSADFDSHSDSDPVSSDNLSPGSPTSPTSPLSPLSPLSSGDLHSSPEQHPFSGSTSMEGYGEDNVLFFDTEKLFPVQQTSISPQNKLYLQQQQHLQQQLQMQQNDDAIRFDFQPTNLGPFNFKQEYDEISPSGFGFDLEPQAQFPMFSST